MNKISRLVGLILVWAIPAVSQQATVTGSIMTLNGSVILNQQGSYPGQPNLEGTSAVIVTVQGTWSATLVPEVSIDNGNWTATQFLNLSTNAAIANLTSNATVGIINTSGAVYVRVRASSYSSGTAVVQLYGRAGAPPSVASSGGGGTVTIVGPLGQQTMANSIPVVVASDQAPVGQATSANSAPVVIASDQSAIQAIGAGLNASGAPVSDIVCTSSFYYDASTSGKTQLVALSGSTHIYICGYEMFAAATVNVSLVAGTGTNCNSAISGTPSVSGATSGQLTPAWEFTAQTGKLSAWPTHGFLIDAGSANALCINTSAGVAVQAQVFYKQQ